MSRSNDLRSSDESPIGLNHQEGSTATETLRRWVFEHKVCWELSPLVEMEQHQGSPAEMVRVGFELQLYGEHAEGSKASAGCPQCVILYDRLRAIAVSALPREHHASRYELSTFDSSLHHRPEMDWVPEVRVIIRIIHGSDYFKAIDGCEKMCAEEIQQHFRELGAHPRVWPRGDSPSAPGGDGPRLEPISKGSFRMTGSECKDPAVRASAGVKERHP